MSNETQPEVRFTIDGQTFTTTNENQTPTDNFGKLVVQFARE